MRIVHYRVADCLFALALPEDKDVARLLPSFEPFCDCPDDGEEPMFRMEVVDAPLPRQEVNRVVEDASNDMGHLVIYETDGGYYVELNFLTTGPKHIMNVERDFSSAKVCMAWGDPYAGESLSSLLRLLYSLAVLLHDGISLHASAVMYEGKAYLFMGKSGTGKSTHSALWQRVFDGCELLNDDNPTLRIVDGEVMVYGTPWSGKTPCYKNVRKMVGGVARLLQSPTNRFLSCSPISAFTAMLPGCSVLRTDGRLYDALCDTLVKVAETVPVGILECLPDEEAARVCGHNLIDTK